MNILVVFPSAFEAKNFKVETNHTVEVLISGIGGFATMYSLTKYCTENRPDFIIHAGICGAFDESFQLGEVVNVMIDHFADFGVTEKGKWKTGFEMGLVSSHKIPFTEGQLVAPNNDIANFPKVIAITSQTITTSNEQMNFLTKRFQASVETMEGAFVHYVCIKEDIPFIHLRAISNYVGERNKEKWETTTALKNLNNAIQEIIDFL